MKQSNDPAVLAGSAPDPPETENLAPYTRTYDCANCRYTDAHGLTCGFCMRKILGEQAEQRCATP